MKIATYRSTTNQRDARPPSLIWQDASWVQFGNRILVFTTANKWGEVTREAKREGWTLDGLTSDIKKGDLYLVTQKGRLFQQAYPDVHVILDSGRYLTIELSAKEAREIGTHPEPCFVVRPLPKNSVVFDQRVPMGARAAPVPWVQHLIACVDPLHYRATLEHLVCYPTRYSTSDHYSDAAAWCRTQLEQFGYDSRLQSITVDNLNSQNVIADKQGDGAGRRELVLLVGHLDSVNLAGGPSAAAPGADDNGSGCAAVLTMANALKNHRAVNDLRLVLFGGEEQGLHGSTQYVKGLSTAERGRIRAVVNMDMVASLNTLDPTVLLEGGTESRGVIDRLANSALTYTSLNVQTSLYPFASDHVPFIEAGLPAVLTIEGADDANENIHSDNDLLEHLDDQLAIEIVRMNLGFTATELDNQGDFTTTGCEPLSHPKVTPQFSGCISYNSGAGLGRRVSARDFLGQPPKAVSNNPVYDSQQPIYRSEAIRHDANNIRFALSTLPQRF